MTKQEQNRYLLLASSTAAGYYFGGKTTKAALIGLGAALVVLYVAKNAAGVQSGLMGAASNGSDGPTVVEPPQPPVSTGNIPAPGTTGDPLNGVVQPNTDKRTIGLLR